MKLEPLFDRDGYPSEQTENVIAAWKGNWREWLTFCARCWRYSDLAQVNGGTFTFITGGWSGNESVIGAMRQNHVGWSLTWQSSHRGGKHVFSVSDLEGGTPTPRSET